MELKYPANNGFGDRLRKAMDAKGASFRWLSDATGYSTGFLSWLAHDKYRFITERKLITIAKVLDVEPEKLLGLSSNATMPSKYLEVLSDKRFLPFQLEAIQKFIEEYPEYKAVD